MDFLPTGTAHENDNVRIIERSDLSDEWRHVDYEAAWDGFRGVGSARRRSAASGMFGSIVAPIVGGSALTLDAEGLADEQKGRGRERKWLPW